MRGELFGKGEPAPACVCRLLDIGRSVPVESAEQVQTCGWRVPIRVCAFYGRV